MLAGLVAVAASLRFGPGLTTLGASLFCWFLIALAFIDLDTQLLPDDLTFPLLWLGLAFNLGNRFVALPDAVIGAIAGYLLLWAVFWAFKLATGKEGMGYGDFKLLAALGAWLGWQALPLIVLLSSALGAAVGLGLMAARRRGKGQPIPFGPFLSFAGIIGMFGGVDLFRRWLWT
jgi:leader peptidase (prepilin peptidase)/N-methyltransferase